MKPSAVAAWPGGSREAFGPASGRAARREPDAPWLFRSRWRVSAALLLGVVVPLALFTGGAVIHARRALEDQAIRQNQVAARLAAWGVQAHFEGLVRYVESYAHRPRVFAAMLAHDTQEMRAHLEDLVQGNQH